MKLTTAKLLKLKIDYGIKDSEIYFKVEEIRKLFPDLRCPPDKILSLNIDGKIQEGIKATDIKELSEFDKKMIQLYNFKK